MNTRLTVSVVLSLLFVVPLAGLPAGCTESVRPAQPEADTASGAEDASEPEPAVVTLFGKRVLLFMEHPRLVVGEPARFLAHFSVLATGEPVRSGALSLEIGATRLAVDAPKRDGLFTPEGAFPQVGRWPGRITITSAQATETLELGDVDVYASAAEARAAVAAAPDAEPADAVPFLMEQQWKLKLLLWPAGPRRLVERLVLPAQVLPAEGATAVVSTPAAGVLLAPGSGRFPRTGERVQAGQELALIEPPLAAADAAQLRALDLQWNLEALAVERSLAEARARLVFAEVEHARLAALRPDGLATQQQLDAAARDLELARTTIGSAESARTALEALRERQAGEAWSAGGTLRLRLLSPIAGEVAATGRVLGEALGAGEPVFRIVDRSRLWIAGRLSEFDLPALDGTGAAVASFPGLPGLRLAVSGPVPGTPFLLAPEFDAVSRTLTLTAALTDPPSVVRAGQLAELQLEVAAVDAAVAIPHEAVVMDQGLPTVYVMLGGETFQRRDVQLGLRDGDFVQVSAGLAPGEHVATRGAGTIRMAALSPSSFGHGHAH